MLLGIAVPKVPRIYQTSKSGIYRSTTMAREIEIEPPVDLIIKGHLYEIGQVNDEVLDGRQGYPMSEQGYHRTLKETAECASIDEVHTVAQRIKDHIQRLEKRPSNRKVRREAREVVTEAGYPATSYLNRA